MKTADSQNPRLWQRYLSLLLMGGFMGGSGVLLWYGHQMEEQMLINRNLRLWNERLTEEVEMLKQSQRAAQRRQDAVIEELRVTVLEPRPHAYIETEVIRQVEKDLAPLKGKKMEQVADMHPILHELLRRREYIIEGKVVEVRLKTAVISRALHVFVTAELKLQGLE